MQYCYFNSPIGRILLGAHDQVLSLLGFPQGKSSYTPDKTWQLNEKPFKAALKQLDEYFAQKRKVFDLAYELHVSEFQQHVLSKVAKVPYGMTCSYGEIAQKIQQPTASRAVGMANARNPLPIIIPCHRIIGKDGSLTGFGGGIFAKEFLLRLEGVL
jgi:methylated-DNA-[protein]-cysteine S-methyltransferase